MNQDGFPKVIIDERKKKTEQEKSCVIILKYLVLSV